MPTEFTIAQESLNKFLKDLDDIEIYSIKNEQIGLGILKNLENLNMFLIETNEKFTKRIDSGIYGPSMIEKVRAIETSRLENLLKLHSFGLHVRSLKSTEVSTPITVARSTVCSTAYCVDGE